ncbi:hypothetical protein [Sinorhizobium medicae]
MLSGQSRQFGTISDAPLPDRGGPMTKPPTSSPSIQSFLPPNSMGFMNRRRPEPRCVKPPGTLIRLPPIRPTNTPPIRVRPKARASSVLRKRASVDFFLPVMAVTSMAPPAKKPAAAAIAGRCQSPAARSSRAAR